MDDEKYWAVYFAGICALQFHPRNPATHFAERIRMSADIADRMLAEHMKRWPIETEEPCPGSSEA